ncbi:phosphoribosylformylglycinamidine synthase subunit PurQ [Ancrocorticia populi]|uniref:Phosphoribosylformylglycinamidine synthase subunit PurQ n=1 Tax=Ancrocorticia populi TaxID=2175228 RepID=A0A2V1K469_9ACTO|nr:phosphoribosylformylglycinamidine synthase subunit PurQ [Ancrocorticia populi]PWF26075.1 phosphoribosylformylglycinamidine synthase subunit PurQ [Ancrocorticia populi]
MKIGVVTFPGTLDDDDAARAIRLAGGEPVSLWHASDELRGVDAVVLPGGFSYGDYLRCGAIAALAPVMNSVVNAANQGLPVLGICNGFQVLCESHLLPGALIRNSQQRFICRDQELAVVNNSTSWTRNFSENETITIPLKNGEGNFQASEEAVAELEGEGHVVFRYAGLNPNGSMNNIAGITNARGNVVGLMPHPEHAVEAGFGVRSASGPRAGTDGLKFFMSVLTSALAA